MPPTSREFKASRIRLAFFMPLNWRPVPVFPGSGQAARHAYNGRWRRESHNICISVAAVSPPLDQDVKSKMR
jgi:hypothetical protein